jgi:Bax protein
VEFLAKIAKIYKIKDITNKEEFLKKIDTIPPSLALAQAAIESGWGKSRFTKEANNLFGHWEYSNNGLKPKSKYDHIKIDYSLKIFPSIEASIAAYMRNLNRNPAYKKFRDLRYKYHKEHKKFTGLIAADTMINYSQLHEKYVELLKKMIKSNHWDKYDN